MRKGVLLLVLLMLFGARVGAQEDGARMRTRANVEAYDDEAGIMKSAYRESPYFMELTGCWDQKKTDSSVVYSREVEVEKFWKDYRVTLNVRCGRACRIALNGKTVGYGGDSRHWNEFALNAYFKYGKKNLLSIETLMHPREALLESDDQMEGLNGEPYLLFKGDPNVDDLTVTADYDAVTTMGTLSLEVSVFNSKKKGKYYVEVEVWDPKGHTFDRMGRWVVFDKSTLATVDLNRSWSGVEPWSAEYPKLYTVVVRLRNEDMEEEELVGARFGFRHVEVKDGLLQMNGKPLTLKGVTYGTKHTEGFAARERMRQDLLAMKKLNINAVRTSRYSPMDPYFYQLCDEMGLYVVCDANLLPASTQQQVVATDKDFLPLFERRVENLYGKYKNYTSIIAWSLGESRDNGICMLSAYKRLKYLDKNRPVIFAGAGFSENTDVIALMKPTEKVLRQSMEKNSDRPFMMLSAVDDNNFADFEGLWSLVENRRNLQGGFIDVWPLGTARAADLKNLFCPFDVQLSKTTIDDAEFLVFNRNNFANFSNYILEYTIFTNLRPNITAGDLPVAIDGGGVESVKLRIPPVEMQPGEELFVRFNLDARHNDNQARVSTTDRTLGTKEFALAQQMSRRTIVNNGAPIQDSSMLSHELFFVDHMDWTAVVVGHMVRRPDDHTLCVDDMWRYSAPGGSVMCDVRTTYTRFSTGDVVVDYTVSPSDRIAADKLHPVLILKAAGDSVTWFGLDRAVAFANRNSGQVGVFTHTTAGDSAIVERKHVRWCATHKGGEGLYAEILGEQFDMLDNGVYLRLYPRSNDTFRLHMRPYAQEDPAGFYGMRFPRMTVGMLEPPTITGSEIRFSQPLTVTISSLPNSEIRYTTDGTEPTETSPRYTSPFVINATTVVKARAFAKDMPPSFTATRKFNYDYIVATSFSRKPNTPFNVGTDTLLFDGEKGVVDDLSMGWLGFSGDGVATTVQLSKPINIDFLTLRFAHSPEMWAFAPRRVTVTLSTDGTTFSDTIQVMIPIEPASEEANSPQLVEVRVPVDRNGIKSLVIDAQSIGVIPAWHRAKGLKPWLMMDEIQISETTQNLHTNTN